MPQLRPRDLADDRREGGRVAAQGAALAGKGAQGLQALLAAQRFDAIAELLRRETAVAQLCVDAAIEGDRQKALQCLLLDPVISDIEVAGQILDDYLTSYRDYLPQFWK